MRHRVQDCDTPQSASKLTHLDAHGHMHMVDIASKAPTQRKAIAQALVRMNAEARRQLKSGTSKKGDVLAAVRLAGIQAAKRTSELIPLCHLIALTRVHIEIENTRCGVRIIAQAECTGATGVEMEALTAASVAALTLYDMLKSVDRGMIIESVQLQEKHGGKNGVWKRQQ